MHSDSFGHTWKLRPGLRPALVTAWRALRRLRGVRLKLKFPLWVADYSVNELERVRVGSPARPWRQRTARTLHLYPPETLFWEDYPADARTLSDCRYILFHGGEAADLGQLVHPRVRYVRFEDPDGAVGAQLLAMAETGSASGEAGFWKAQAELCALLDLLLSGERVDDETRRIRVAPLRAGNTPFVQQAREQMGRHLAEGITLEALARHLHVSVSTLSHRYRAETGQSPVQWLLEARINMAKGMLLKGQTLKAVAEATGFSDAFHLSKTFKRLEGVAPRHYLRSLRQTERPAAAQG